MVLQNVALPGGKLECVHSLQFFDFMQWQFGSFVTILTKISKIPFFPQVFGGF